MTDEQWAILVEVIEGKAVEPLPVGFIIDSPWLPGWSGVPMMDYFNSEEAWFEAYRRAVRRFPSVMFLPGFWAEYGMCTEPSAFGAECVWEEDGFPFARRVFDSWESVAGLERPNPRTDGLPPSVLQRIENMREKIAQEGHAIRFATARGPLNIAAFLLGDTELFLGMRTHPEAVHGLLATISDFLVEWLQLQAATVSTIDGVLILDDYVGFIGEAEFVEFVEPHLRRVFQALDVTVRFFHNDAHGLVCAPHLAGLGVNLFNFSHEHGLGEMRALVGESVTLLGNIPPRDVMADGTPGDVRESVRRSLATIDDRRRLIMSCGGGMPPGVSTENIEAVLEVCGHRVQAHGKRI